MGAKPLNYGREVAIGGRVAKHGTTDSVRVLECSERHHTCIVHVCITYYTTYRYIVHIARADFI